MYPAAGGLPARNDIHFKKGDISVNEGKFLAMGTSWQSENLLTPRKIGVGSTKEQVLDAYGSPAFVRRKIYPRFRLAAGVYLWQRLSAGRPGILYFQINRQGSADQILFPGFTVIN
jgi:hypothetical protein